MGLGVRRTANGLGAHHLGPWTIEGSVQRDMGFDP